jgi:hypothetical protein
MGITKKRIIKIGTLIGILVISSQTNAYADFEKIINVNHNNFGVEVTFNQQNTTDATLSEGYLDISMKFTDIRPQFNPYIVGDGFECIAKQASQWDTYYTLRHHTEIVSTDYIGDQYGPSKSGRLIRILTNVKLAQNGVPLFNSSNPNYEISFDEWNPQEVIEKEAKLSDYFSLQGQQLVSKPFTFPVYAGEEFIITHSTYADQYFDCPRNISGGHSIGKDLESFFTLKIEKKVQKITAQIPLELALADKMIRIVYSSSSKLPVTAIERSPKVCIVDRDIVNLKSKGDCIIELSQIGDKFFHPAETVVKKIKVVAESSSKLISITCIQGKLTKKVTAVKPKCPAGYKKK